MPDIGRFGRGIAQRAKETSQQAAAKVSQTYEDHRHASGGGDSTSASGDDGDTASSTEVTEEVGRLQALLARRRPTPGPVVGRWSVGIGDLLAEHPRIPSQLRGMARHLDCYGGLAITEQAVAFDGDEIEWATVTEIRTRNVVDYLLSNAVNQQLHNIPLPWFPGRRKLLDAVSKALLTLLIAAAKQQLDRPNIDIRIPAEIEYRSGGGRRHEVTPGVVAALILIDPAVSQCLQATARAHGIDVCPADDELLQTLDERAVKLRLQFGALKACFEGATQSDLAALPCPPSEGGR
jgi:hypothetical protein